MSDKGKEEDIQQDESPQESNSKLLFDDEEIETRLALKDLPFAQVTVFKDRAEVTRPIDIALRAGKNKIIVYGFPDTIDPDTARAKGGQGNATLLEVTFNKVALSAKEKAFDESKQDEDETHKALRLLAKEKKSLQRAAARLKTERGWIDGWAEAVRNPSKGEDVMAMMSNANFESVGKFLTFYQDRLASLDVKEAENKKELARVAGEIDHLEKNKGKAKQVQREVHITLQVHEDTKVSLPLQYLVSGASWDAEYNLRLNTDSAELQIQYFGMISNKTKEDWTDSRIFLSTAEPSAGGKPPDLPAKYLSLRNPSQYRHTSARNSSMTNPVMNLAMTQTAMYNAAPSAAYALSDVDECDDGADIPTNLAVAETVATKGSTSTTFEIPREATIPYEKSGERKHKVTVGIMVFEAKFVYTTVPMLEQKAYLRADMTHKGDYIILPGPYRVFMDNNLVSKSNFKQVSPGEKFTVFLGADDEIKVELNKIDDKKGTSGSWIGKVNQKEVANEFIVKNLKDKPYKVFIYAALPQTTISKIKVKCIEPKFDEDNANVKQTEMGNIEWNFTIKPGKKKVVKSHYLIEFPKGSTIYEANS